jgi:hypothetical protein
MWMLGLVGLMTVSASSIVAGVIALERRDMA